MLLWTVKGREATFPVVMMTLHSKLIKRDIESLYDKPYSFTP